MKMSAIFKFHFAKATEKDDRNLPSEEQNINKENSVKKCFVSMGTSK